MAALAHAGDGDAALDLGQRLDRGAEAAVELGHQRLEPGDLRAQHAPRGVDIRSGGRHERVKSQSRSSDGIGAAISANARGRPASSAGGAALTMRANMTTHP